MHVENIIYWVGKTAQGYSACSAYLGLGVQPSTLPANIHTNPHTHIHTQIVRRIIKSDAQIHCENTSQFDKTKKNYIILYMLITDSVFQQAGQCKISYISMITSSAKLKTFGVFLVFCLIFSLFLYQINIC